MPLHLYSSDPGITRTVRTAVPMPKRTESPKCLERSVSVLKQQNRVRAAKASDCWAIGVCLWVFLYGSLPFYSRDQGVLFDAICNQPLR